LSSLPHDPDVITFDVFDLSLSTHELFHQGTRVKLPPQAFRVLQMLLERPGQLVTRDEFHHALWPADTFVDFDQGLNNAIKRIRGVLNDSAEAPRFIETLPRLGYRFVGKINSDSGALQTNGSGENIHLVWKAANASPHAVHREPAVSESEEGMATVVSPVAERVPASNQAVETGKLLIFDHGRSRSRGGLWAVGILAITILMLAGVMLRHRLLPTRSAHAPLEWEPLTTLPGSENAPTFSPNGEEIAFDYLENGEWNIFTKRIDDDRVIRITDPPDWSSCPSWSPDGRHVAYLRGAEVGGLRLRSGIFLMSPSGGGKRRLLDAGNISCRVGWSPDSKTLVYGPGWSATEKPGLFLVDIDNPVPRRLLVSPPGTADFGPEFSHDGTRIVFGRSTGLGVQDLYVVARSGGEAHRITRINANLGAPLWTSDDQRVIFWAGSGWTGALYQVSANGGTPEKLPLGTHNVGRPALSSDGRLLAYVQPAFDPNIWRVDLSTINGHAEKFIASTWTEFSPDFSPDNKKIAFLSDRDDTQAIWICSAECSNPQKLLLHSTGSTEAPTRLGLPRWSPRGDQIAFDALHGEHRQIFVVDAAGGEPLRITAGQFENQAPSWSADGSWIYFGSDRSGRFEIWKTSLRTHETEQVTRNGGYFAEESADGRFVFYKKPQDDMSTWTYDKPGLYAMPTDGGQERLIAPVKGWLWRVTKRGVYYADNDAKPHPVLKLFVLDSAKTETVAMLDKRSWGGPGGIAISSDGKTLLYSQIDAEGSDLMLVKNGLW
jgi:Tol biopolymer transport system component/DNA-binding winged helix-turn-helix (wHTH) protein